MRRTTTLDCGVAGCKRAAYKYGICRRHHSMLPFTFHLDYIGAVFDTYARMNRKAARLARAAEKQNSSTSGQGQRRSGDPRAKAPARRGMSVTRQAGPSSGSTRK